MRLQACTDALSCLKRRVAKHSLQHLCGHARNSSHGPFVHEVFVALRMHGQLQTHQELQAASSVPAQEQHLPRQTDDGLMECT